jgi:hypothetical protein
MKILPFSLIVSLWIGSFTATLAADTNNVPPAIGIYDSRAVAYAYFWSAPCQKQQREKVSAAQAARKAGDVAKLKEYDAAFRAQQAELHRMVFSTAPATTAMDAIKERIPEIQKLAGVSALISKWDEPSLKKFPGAARVDITDKLVREFIQPDEKQTKMILSIEKSEPMSLEKCDELIRKGEI